MSEPKQTPTSTTGPTRTTGQVVQFRGTALKPQESFPLFTWAALEQQLAELAVTPTQRALAQTLVSATRKQAPFKPADLVLREVLCIASVLMDESFHPESGQPEAEEGEMT